jgi:hypothetical protein
MRPFARVLSKLDEARFFFARFASASDVRKATFYFDAFLTAARSVTFTMQAVCSKLPDFSGWYATEQGTLASDPMARFLLELRNETQKVGLVPIHYSGVGTRLSKRGHFRCSVRYRLAALDGGAPPLAGDVRDACQAHLARLAGAVSRCYAQYAGEVDPAGTLGPQVAKLSRRVRVVVPQCPLGSGPWADVVRGAIEACRLEAREPAGVRLGGGGDAV